MSDLERIVDELRNGHAGDPWHGPSRASVLADVTAEEAHRRPSASGHTIWELVLHMRAWTNEVARRVREGNPRMPAEGDFPSPSKTSPAAWKSAVLSLDAAHAGLVESVRTMGAARLDEPVGGQRDAPLGSGVTHSAMLHGLSQHDAYHTGQIAILKKIYRGDAEL